MSIAEESRNFRRYAKSLGFTLKFRERPIRAETVNYSLQGLGVLLKGHPPIKKGDILHIGQIEIGNAGDASVAWTRPESDSTFAGFSLIRPIEGNFRHFRFADIVRGFQKGRKTGTFALSGGLGTKVFIKGGEIIFATSEKQDDNLDVFLLRKGKLTEEQYFKARKEGRMTGQNRVATLIRLGYLKPAELIEAVKLQAEEILASIFSRDDCYFTFHEGVLPERDLVTMKFPASNLIYRGLKETNSSLILEQYSPSHDDVIRFTASQSEFWAISLDEEDRKILTLIDGKRSLGEILKLSPFGEKATIRSISALIGAGIVEAGELEVIPEEAVTHSGTIEDSWAPLGKEKAVLSFNEGMRLLERGRPETALRLFEEAISLDPSEARYYLYKAITLRRLGKSREAEEAISLAFNLDPTNPDIIEELNRLDGKGR